MITLRTFVESNSVTPFRSFEDYADGLYTAQLEAIASQITLVPLSPGTTSIIPPRFLRFDEYLMNDHSKFIDELVQHIVSNNIDNVLVEGYIDGTSNIKNSANSLICPGVNQVVQLLKGPIFKVIHDIVKSRNFFQMLFNYTAFTNGNMLMLWGNVSSNKYSPRSNTDLFSIKRMMYKRNSSLQNRQPLPFDSKKLLSLIFGVDYKTGVKNIPKNLRSLDSILKKMISNHQSKQFNYPYILDQICGKISFDDLRKPFNNFSMVTDKKLIVKFVITIIRMVTPLELFGTKSNMSRICSKVASIIFAKHSEMISIDKLQRDIKTLDIPWICKDKSNQSKQAFETYQIRLKHVLKWFFQSFIFNLVSSFFYVTEISQSTKLVYFRIQIWKRISQSFQDSYFHKHLSHTGTGNNKLGKFSENNDYIGFLRLIPKEKDFRLIVTPYKAEKFGFYDYYLFLNKEIKLLSMVLNSKRQSDSLKSVSQFGLKIAQFKSQLVHKYGDSTLPTIHALSFDIKHAYDSVPLMKVREAVANMFPEGCSPVYVKVLQLIEKNVKLFKKINLVEETKVAYTDFKESIIKGMKDDQTYVNCNTTVAISRSDVLDMLESQIRKPAVILNKKTFHRKDGLFQGFPLSGILCDIVYDDLLRYLQSQISKDHETDCTLVVRLADDFLVLSANKEVITKYAHLISKPIAEFNVTVNQNKTKLATDRIKFLGYDLDLGNLTVFKHNDTYNNNMVRANSFQKLYHRIEVFFQLRLKNSIFNNGFNGYNAIIKSLKSLVRSAIIQFSSSFRILNRLDSFRSDLFYLFLKRLESIKNKRFKSDLKLQESVNIQNAFVNSLKVKNMLPK